MDGCCCHWNGGPADIVTVCGDTTWPRCPCPLPRADCWTGPSVCPPGWNVSQPSLSHRQIVDLSTTPLPRLSKKYNCWLSRFGPKTDSNLYASLYSSRVTNAGYNMVPIYPSAFPPCCS